jgi:hypothetical protein
MQPIRAVFALLCFACLLSCSDRTATSQPAADRPFSLSDASKSTLRVVAFGGSWQEGVSAGSGVAISPNFVLTNLHVVEIAYQNPNSSVYVWDDSAGFPRPVSAIIETDPRLDLAVLYVRGITSEPVTIALAEPRQLQEVTALGFPASTDMVFDRLRAGVSATSGQVTAIDEGTIGEFGPVRLIMHTATLNAGNSGGPLFNACGQLVGINTLKADPIAASNVFVSSAPDEIMGFLDSYEIPFQTASRVCGLEWQWTNCEFDASAMEDAIAQRDLTALDRQLRLIPEQCGTIANRGWLARRELTREMVSRFLQMSGSWRLQDDECANRMSVTISGLAVWGRAGRRLEIERFTGINDRSVSTRTSFPENAGSDNYSYTLVDDRLRIENRTDSTSWEMLRCTG